LPLLSLSIRVFEGKVGRGGRKKERKKERRKGFLRFSFLISPPLGKA